MKVIVFILLLLLPFTLANVELANNRVVFYDFSQYYSSEIEERIKDVNILGSDFSYLDYEAGIDVRFTDGYTFLPDGYAFVNRTGKGWTDANFPLASTVSFPDDHGITDEFSVHLVLSVNCTSCERLLEVENNILKNDLAGCQPTAQLTPVSSTSLAASATCSLVDCGTSFLSEDDSLRQRAVIAPIFSVGERFGVIPEYSDNGYGYWKSGYRGDTGCDMATIRQCNNCTVSPFLDNNFVVFQSNDSVGIRINAAANSTGFNSDFRLQMSCGGCAYDGELEYAQPNFNIMEYKIPGVFTSTDETYDIIFTVNGTTIKGYVNGTLMGSDSYPARKSAFDLVAENTNYLPDSRATWSLCDDDGGLDYRSVNLTVDVNDDYPSFKYFNFRDFGSSNYYPPQARINGGSLFFFDTTVPRYRVVLGSGIETIVSSNTLAMLQAPYSYFSVCLEITNVTRHNDLIRGFFERKFSGGVFREISVFNKALNQSEVDFVVSNFSSAPRIVNYTHQFFTRQFDTVKINLDGHFRIYEDNKTCTDPSTCPKCVSDCIAAYVKFTPSSNATFYSSSGEETEPIPLDDFHIKTWTGNNYETKVRIGIYNKYGDFVDSEEMTLVVTVNASISAEVKPQAIEAAQLVQADFVADNTGRFFTSTENTKVIYHFSFYSLERCSFLLSNSTTSLSISSNITYIYDPVAGGDIPSVNVTGTIEQLDSYTCVFAYFLEDTVEKLNSSVVNGTLTAINPITSSNLYSTIVEDTERTFYFPLANDQHLREIYYRILSFSGSGMLYAYETQLVSIFPQNLTLYQANSSLVNFSIVPALDYIGSFTLDFEVYVADGLQKSSEYSIVITTNQTYLDPPIAYNVSFTLVSSDWYNFTLNGTDVDAVQNGSSTDPNDLFSVELLAAGQFPFSLTHFDRKYVLDPAFDELNIWGNTSMNGTTFNMTMGDVVFANGESHFTYAFPYILKSRYDGLLTDVVYVTTTVPNNFDITMTNTSNVIKEDTNGTLFEFVVTRAGTSGSSFASHNTQLLCQYDPYVSFTCPTDFTDGIFHINIDLSQDFNGLTDICFQAGYATPSLDQSELTCFTFNVTNVADIPTFNVFNVTGNETFDFVVDVLSHIPEFFNVSDIDVSNYELVVDCEYFSQSCFFAVGAPKVSAVISNNMTNVLSVYGTLAEVNSYLRSMYFVFKSSTYGAAIDELDISVRFTVIKEFGNISASTTKEVTVIGTGSDPGEFPWVILAIIGGGSGISLIIIIIVLVIIIIIIIIVLVIIVAVLAKVALGGKSKIKLPPPPPFGPIVYGNVAISDEEKQFATKISDVLGRLLTEAGFGLAQAFCEEDITSASASEKMAKALVHLVEGTDPESVVPMLKHAIRYEVGVADSSGVLFRSNSIASKMLKFYSKMIGLPYVYDTLGLILLKLSMEETSLEVDPNKTTEEDDVKVNKWRLLATAQQCLSAITGSLDDIPYQFREICSHLQKEVVEKFPESKHTAVGGYIFLRFYVPSLTAPDMFGLLKEAPEAQTRRLLILVAKTLQNLSNGTEFRESHMKEMNAFINSNLSLIEKFFDDVATLPRSDKGRALVEKMPKNAKLLATMNVYRHLYAKQRDVIAYLDRSDQPWAEGLKIRLTEMLREHGEPPRES